MSMLIFLAQRTFIFSASQAGRGEGTFNRIRRSDVLPVLGRKVVEAQQSIAVPGQAFDRLVVFGPVGFKKEVDQSPSGAVRVCRLVRFGIFGRDLRMALSS